MVKKVSRITTGSNLDSKRNADLSTPRNNNIDTISKKRSSIIKASDVSLVNNAMPSFDRNEENPAAIVSISSSGWRLLQQEILRRGGPINIAKLIRKNIEEKVAMSGSPVSIYRKMLDLLA